jgi:hypothetical protein
MHTLWGRRKVVICVERALGAELGLGICVEEKNAGALVVDGDVGALSG